VYVISGERAEERIVTIGQAADDLIEITTGLKTGEIVATTNVEKLSDGAHVTAQK
jgi:multidrug efflux pump subunit AcrA (membrane-fusion protein)